GGTMLAMRPAAANGCPLTSTPGSGRLRTRARRPRDRERLPVFTAAMLGKHRDLADVLRGMNQRPGHRLEGGHFLAPDADDVLEVGRGQRIDRAEQHGPAALPFGQRLLACQCDLLIELLVAFASRLLAVRSEEVGPPRMHVAGHVSYEDADAVGLRIEQE